jgi:hypothetical protein
MRISAASMRVSWFRSTHFLEVYERAFHEVYSYVASRLSDRAAAEDVTQEVLVMGARHVARGGHVDVVACLKTGAVTSPR